MNFGDRAGTRGELHDGGSPLVPRWFPPLASSEAVQSRPVVSNYRTMLINAEITTDAISMEECCNLHEEALEGIDIDNPFEARAKSKL